jgi:hypothetical protein
MPTFFLPRKPNARFQALPEARARNERRLEAVARKPWFGIARWHGHRDYPPVLPLQGHSSANPIQVFRIPPDSKPEVGYRPSHARTAASTAASWVGESTPNFLSNFACGMVTRFWASNTPGRRKRVVIATSKRDPRGLVVCATIVMSARSCSATGTLRTRHGRTFAASPRSTNHTSPRCVAGICGFSAVEFKKEGFRAQYQLLICE